MKQLICTQRWEDFRLLDVTEDQQVAIARVPMTCVVHTEDGSVYARVRTDLTAPEGERTTHYVKQLLLAILNPGDDIEAAPAPMPELQVVREPDPDMVVLIEPDGTRNNEVTRQYAVNWCHHMHGWTWEELEGQA